MIKQVREHYTLPHLKPGYYPVRNSSVAPVTVLLHRPGVKSMRLVLKPHIIQHIDVKAGDQFEFVK